MAPLPVIADVFRVAMQWKHGSGLTAENVMHFSAPASDASDVFTALDAHVTAAMWAHTTTDVALNQIEITPLDGTDVTLTLLNGWTTAHWTGSQTGGIVPQVACMLKLTTGKRGRSYRGRAYLPFCAESKVDGGIFDPTLQASMTTAWATWRAAMAVDSVTPVVASYKLATAEFIASTAIEHYCGTQRRRQPR